MDFIFNLRIWKIHFKIERTWSCKPMFANLRLRLKIAWYAFWLIPFNIKLKPFEITGATYHDWECDNKRSVNKCKNNMEVCVGETWANFNVEKSRSYLVCKPCAEIIVKTGEEFDFD